MRLHQRLALTIFLVLLACPCSIYADCEDDPYGFANRPTYYFNNFLDRLYMRPTAIAYDYVLPLPVKSSVSNFYGNLSNFLTMINDVLQFQFGHFIKDTARFTINSTLGLAGLFDVATPMGLQPHKADLGQTFYVWGWKNSSYYVIPLLGPSTIRDSLGLLGEAWLWPPSYFKPRWRNFSYILALINRRYEMRDLEALIGVAGVDNYELVRSGYMQNRIYILTGEVATPLTNGGVDMLGEPPE